MSEQNKQLVRRWFEEVWNRQDETAIDEMFDANGKAYGFPEPQSAIGRDEFKSNHRIFVGAFPDIHVEIEDVIAEGDRVAVRWVFTMTHRGDQLGFAATGKAVRVDGSTFLVIQEGRIREGWNQMDLRSMLSELRSMALQSAAVPASALVSA
jgi:steroid delta-isomerase-like uncharacterized protein